VSSHIGLDLLPVAPVISDLLAGGADRHDALQGLDLLDGMLQFLNKSFPFYFDLLAFRDVLWVNRSGS
jgi:hypothetical protein